MNASSSKSHFRNVQSFKVNFAPATVTRYVSARSGMEVVVVDRKGPKIVGHFVLATEIFDDSGAPHTLEHLVFMGSKNYQYKGLLDKLASRAYSSTNAWTSTDHTAYTLDTAGWDGCAQILPIYLEHILVPTLTDDACYTEVYHVNAEGNDAGVVFSEIQALENTSDELMDIKARRLLYPENVGFRYETGGMMKALSILTAEKIRDFHKAMYQPRNLRVILEGEIDHGQLLQILDRFEESIKDHIPPVDSPFSRPWIDSPQPPPLKKSILETIDFPDRDESRGEIQVAWLGPNTNDLVATAALNIISTYLCGSSASVLRKRLVEQESLASSIQISSDQRPDTVIWLYATGVATDNLEKVYKRMLELIKEVVYNPLNMDYIIDCIKRERRQVVYAAEGSLSFFSDIIITDFLFGKRDGSTLGELAKLDEYDTLEAWKEQQWKDFLLKWIVNAHSVAVIGKPSADMAKRIKQETKDKIAKRKADLGKGGLEKLKTRLEEAIAHNERPIPDQVLDKWTVPPTSSIHFISSETAKAGVARTSGTLENNEAQRLIDSMPATNNLFIQFEHVETSFVHIKVHIGVSQIPVHLKPIIPIVMDTFFRSPIRRNGELIEFDDVVRALERDTISFDIRTWGQMFSGGEAIAVGIAVERAKYGAAVQWLASLISDVIVDPGRLKASLSKSLARVPQVKRSGSNMCDEIDTTLHIESNSLVAAKRWLAKAVYYKRLRRLLEKDPNVVLAWLTETRRLLFSKNNVRVLVIANVLQLERPIETWDVFYKCLTTPDKNSSAGSVAGDSEILPIAAPWSVLSESGRFPGKEGAIIVVMPAVESSFAVCTTTGPISWTDERIPALLVALHYLEAVEGVLWTALRGPGLAYSYAFDHDLDRGVLQFSVYRAPNVFQAIRAAADSIRAICGSDVSDDSKSNSRTAPLVKPLLEGAISQAVVEFVDGAATMHRAATSNFIREVLLKLPKGWVERNLAAVRAVREEEVKRMMREVIMPVFEPGTSNIVVTCGPELEANLISSFQKLGFKARSRKLSDFHDDYGIAPLEGDDEDDDEEEEEEEDVNEDGDDNDDDDDDDEDNDTDMDSSDESGNSQKSDSR